MLNFNLTIGILFWLPVVIVLIYNLLWDIRFFQSNNFSFQYLYQSIRWDFEHSHRKRIVLWGKLVLFMGIVAFILWPINLITPLCVAGIYFVWVGEAFECLEKIYLKRNPKLYISPRSGFVLTASLVIMLTLPFLTTLAIAIDSPSLNSLSILELAKLIPADTVTGIETPAIYVYLIFSGLIGLILDLGSPLIVMVSVMTSKPLSWLFTEIQIAKAHNKLRHHPKLIIVGITGSTGKTTTRNILSHILRPHLQVVTTPYSQVTIRSLANTILNSVTYDTQVLIVEMNAFKPGDIKRLCRLTPPHLSIVTGVDESHIGVFGDISRTLEAKSEILTHIRPNGTAILNIDDSHVQELMYKYQLKEIPVFTKSQLLDDITRNEVNSDFFFANHITTDNNKLSMQIQSGSGNFSIELSEIPRYLVSPILCAVAAAVELGITPDQITTELANFVHIDDLIQTTSGDDSTTILHDLSDQSYKKFRHNLEKLTWAIQEGQHTVLVTNGIRNLGKYKRDVYSDLAKIIHEHVDFLITTDTELARKVKINNSGTQIFTARDSDEIIYLTRQILEPGCRIMLLGELDVQILTELMS